MTTVPRQTPQTAIELTPLPLMATHLYGTPLVGSPSQLGATYNTELDAVNFAVYSSAASGVSLVLFTEADLVAGRVTAELPLHPKLNRTGDVWHILLPRLDTSLLYAYRVDGLHQDKPRTQQHGARAPSAHAATPPAPPAPAPPAHGHRCDASKVVLDPYAVGIMSRRRYGELAPELDYANPDVLGLARTWPQAAAALPQPPSVDAFDWQGDAPLHLPMEDLVIYEMHVRGFTAGAGAGVTAPGTYLGVVEKLDYLRSLGVNAIELLPVFEFNELEYYSPIPGSTTGEHRLNFWGYSQVGYFSPMARYSFAIANGADASALRKEFKLLVREAHKRGIEVILDVVFNHTAEGNEQGPTLSFRGLDNRTYYMLAPEGQYYNYSGCGNTFNCNHPVVRSFITDCLRYWVTEYHIDGFRFDLASIMTRAHSAWQPAEQAGGAGPTAPHSGGAIVDEAGLMTDGAGVPTGTPLADPPLIEAISQDPVLKNTKLIAEAWDCDGLNQVGAFPHYGGRWSEWNGTFRDAVRQFLKGTDGAWAGAFASALCGSPNIYASSHPGETDWWGNNGGRKWRGGRAPTASVNFICAHDGFTLADLVAYNNKHNEANGEGNNDGESHNLSWNCGEEGPTKAPAVNRLRQRQMRNLACALLLSHGVPMLQMGDEYGHSKNGNNNTYCHDSELNWVDWRQVDADDTGFGRFMRGLINFRRTHPELRRRTYVTDNDIQWHGEKPLAPDWTEASRLVAYTLSNGLGGGLYVAFNTSHLPRMLELPHWPGRVWLPMVDTSRVAPYDVLMPDELLSEEEVLKAHQAQSMWTASSTFPLLPWSCCVLESVPEEQSATLRVRAGGSSNGLSQSRL